MTATPRAAARRAALALLLAGMAAAPAARATSLQFCDRPQAVGADRQDLLLRFGAVVRDALDRSGRSVALVARSGLDLDRFGVRYSHAGVSVRDGAGGRWSVRQLYYACDEGRPRLYDQGLAGFVVGSAGPAPGRIAVVTLPAPAADALARVALDNAAAGRLLAARYSANAYPFGTSYQNCNQWLAELLALAWGEPAGGGHAREDAQRWLRDEGYEPEAIDAGAALMLLGVFVPWVHRADHPVADLERGVFRVSLPASIEAFVARTVAGAERTEFCQDGRRIVVRHGWTPLDGGCTPARGDDVLTLAR